MPEMIPNPVQVMLCGVCNQSWKEHERLAERSWWDAQDIDFEGDAPKHFEVTLEQCVELLQKANRGPQGDAGPPGPAGLNASGRSSISPLHG